MKVWIWLVGALLWALWTGLALAADALLEGLVASGDWAERVRQAQQTGLWPWPAQWTQWIPTEWLSAAAQALAAALGALLAAWPWVRAAVGWLSPLLWLAWGLGTALLLGLCAPAQWAVGQWAPRLRGAV